MSIVLMHFDLAEFACKCGECGSTGAEMDPDFLYMLDNLREDCGFPFIVTSGYRCPDYNDEIASTGRDGPHTTGKAVDISAAFAQAHTLLKKAMHRDIPGIGINGRGEYRKRFIHLDTLRGENSRPRVWTY